VDNIHGRDDEERHQEHRAKLLLLPPPPHLLDLFLIDFQLLAMASALRNDAHTLHCTFIQRAQWTEEPALPFGSSPRAKRVDPESTANRQHFIFRFFFPEPSARYAGVPLASRSRRATLWDENGRKISKLFSTFTSELQKQKRKH